MTNEATKPEETTDLAGRPEFALLCADVKAQMLRLTKKEPIRNTGSFPMVILWQIFEAASDDFEEWKLLAKYNDDDIEAMLRGLFPRFIAGYPDVMTLDA